MRRLIPLLLLGIITVAGSYQVYTSTQRSSYPAPDFVLPDLEGRSHQLSRYHGKVVFLNLWTTWCPPCREEMPSMERLHRTYADRGLVVLAVSEDEGPAEEVAAFARSLSLTFPILLDPTGQLPSDYGVSGYPETFLIDRTGHIVQHTIGPADWFRPAFQAHIEALLAAPADTPISG